jgi:hypothetical protein
MRQRIRSHLTFANVVSLAALFVALGGTTYAATGGNFILGRANSASSTSSLTTPVAGKGLQVTNTSTHAGASALGLNVASGHAPFTVNSGAKVANLNADKLDGVDSTGFLPSSNVKAWHWAASDCINGTEPGCQSTFSFGGLSFGATCRTGAGLADLKLDNTSNNIISAAYIISPNNAQQFLTQAHSQIFELVNPPNPGSAQGSLMEANDAVSNPDSLNFEVRYSTDGVSTSCGLQAVAVRAR